MEQLYLAGEMEFEKKKRRLKEGIPMLSSTTRILDEPSDELGLKKLKRTLP